MKIIRPFFIVFTSLSFILPSTAAEDVAPLTWDECVTLAKKSNPDYISSSKTAEASRADYRGSYNGLLPSLTLSNIYTKTNNSSSESTRWGAQGRASMDLFNLNENANIKSAAASFDRAQADLASQSADVRFSLRKAFADLLFAQEQVNVSKEILKLRHGNADMVSLKYDSGRESKGNMLQAKAELKEAEANLAEAIRDLRVGQRSLNSQLGRDHFDPLFVSGTMAVNNPPPLPDVDAIADANPKVSAQKAAQTIAEANVNAAKSSLWPTLSANYTRSFSGDGYFPGNPSWSASGVLTYPLFGSGLTSTYFAVSSAKRSLEKADADLQSVRNEIRALLENAWAAFSNAVDQVSVQATFLEASRQRNDEANVRYSSGLMSFEDWERVVSDLVNFERSRLLAERNAVIAEASWDQAKGKTLEEQ